MNRKSALIAWIFVAAVALACIFGFARDLRAGEAAAGSDLAWNLVLLEFGAVGALIISKQPGNRVGWLLMIPALVVIPDTLLNTAAFSAPAPAPPAPTALLALTLWFDNWSWVPPLLAVWLLPIFFPTGRPHTPRWRSVAIYAICVAVVFILGTAFVSQLRPSEGDPSWAIRNPVGFIPIEFLNGDLFNTLWLANLALVTLLSVTSLVARYRRAGSRERRQIKVLLYTCVMFVALYVIQVALLEVAGGSGGGWGFLMVIGVGAIPLAIAYSILRYQLFDIDLVIRRTLVYAVVTALLGLVFYGSIILLQRLFTGLTGQQSPVALVASTLAIAALFSPLRRRVQNVVDRRFYRRKYDAQQVLAQFGAVARNETDVNRIEVSLASAVEETLQPESLAVWLK